MRKPRSPKPEAPAHENLKLSSRGIAMLLGELEHALLEASWSLARPASARELHARIVKTRPVEQITAVTVLNRLAVVKRLMRRRKVDDLYHYEPTFTRAEFVERATRQVAERVLTLGADAVTASFVDVLADRDPGQLDELARLVRQKLRERKDK